MAKQQKTTTQTNFEPVKGEPRETAVQRSFFL
jgi:hypothetical protein